MEAFAPYLKVTRVTPPQGPIGPFETADIELEYDLLGTPAGMSSFDVIVYSKTKPPRGGDLYEDFRFMSWPVGTGMTTTVSWSPRGSPVPPDGSYKIKFIARTAGDAYGGEHVKSPFRAKVKVDSGN